MVNRLFCSGIGWGPGSGPGSTPPPKDIEYLRPPTPFPLLLPSPGEETTDSKAKPTELEESSSNLHDAVLLTLGPESLGRYHGVGI